MKNNIHNLMNKILNKQKNDVWFSNSCGLDVAINFQDYIIDKYYTDKCKNKKNNDIWQKCSDFGYKKAYINKYANDVYLFLNLPSKYLKIDKLFHNSVVKTIKKENEYVIFLETEIGCVLDFLNHYYLPRNKNVKPIINYIGMYVTNLYKIMIDEIEKRISSGKIKNWNNFNYKQQIKNYGYFKKKFSTKRKAPILKSTSFKVGTKKIGIDTNMWIVIQKKNGKNIWKKI